MSVAGSGILIPPDIPIPGYLPQRYSPRYSPWVLNLVLTTPGYSPHVYSPLEYSSPWTYPLRVLIPLSTHPLDIPPERTWDEGYPPPKDRQTLVKTFPQLRCYRLYPSSLKIDYWSWPLIFIADQLLKM